ncbi:hypothetical protein A9Q99_25585 [Gammaproteobacteria bacterium 45_16_T64]|nr:hypothetical protein A9Q99_25585 [Gammaproteobacteria bacterium 45_16_T64]
MKRPICADCQRPLSVCYCHALTRCQNSWPIHILQHPAESKHAIGTARIAELSLSQCRLQVGENFDLSSLGSCDNEDGNVAGTLLVYPGGDSQPLETLAFDTPQRLVLIDASWRKSRRMLLESPEIMALPKVSLTPSALSRYKIRKVPNPNALSTLEAIVSALSIVESSPDVYHAMLETMDWMIDKQIELMGREVFEKNYSGHLKS